MEYDALYLVFINVILKKKVFSYKNLSILVFLLGLICLEILILSSLPFIFYYLDSCTSCAWIFGTLRYFFLLFFPFKKGFFFFFLKGLV